MAGLEASSKSLWLMFHHLQVSVSSPERFETYQEKWNGPSMQVNQNTSSAGTEFLKVPRGS
eukprot:1791272-Prorocentrum_lima.AAC.1